ncbi:MAG: TIGR04076 family protein [Candidatus Heimdallarchaeota archaeon]
MPYKRIVVEIISQEGNCAAGLKVGDKIIFEDGEVKGKFCISAMYSVIPKIYAMKYEANFPGCSKSPSHASYSRRILRVISFFFSYFNRQKSQN